MNVPEDLEYTVTHEWVRLEGASAQLGVTDSHPIMSADCQGFRLVAPGSLLRRGDAIAVVETLHGPERVYTPLSGTITEVNSGVTAELVRKDPYGEGWLVRMNVEAGEELELLQEPAVYSAHLEANRGADI